MLPKKKRARRRNVTDGWTAIDQRGKPTLRKREGLRLALLLCFRIEGIKEKEEYIFKMCDYKIQYKRSAFGPQKINFKTHLNLYILFKICMYSL